jgi:hypothetical protein
MFKRLLSLALLLPVFACAVPSGEDTQASSAASTAVKPMITSGDTTSVQIAPGETQGVVYVQGDWGDSTTSFSLLNLPTGVTAKYSQTGAASFGQGPWGYFALSASPSTLDGHYSLTVAEETQGAPGQLVGNNTSYPVALTVSGTCQPYTCVPGYCGVRDNGCSGTINCGGCDSGEYCNATSLVCESTSPLKCKAGTQDCGGYCAKRCT